MSHYLITVIVLILFELGIFFKIKTLIYQKAWEYRKPFDCFFCLSLWFNLFLLILSQNLTQFAIAILITKTIDLLWNKN